MCSLSMYRASSQTEGEEAEEERGVYSLDEAASEDALAHPCVDQDEWVGVLKVVLRNIPNRCTRAEVLRQMELQNFGHGKGDMESFHMPWRSGESANSGYAVLEFRDNAAALAFRDAFTGFQFPDRLSNKRLLVTPWRFPGHETAPGSVRLKARRKAAPRSDEVPPTQLWPSMAASLPQTRGVGASTPAHRTGRRAKANSSGESLSQAQQVSLGVYAPGALLRATAQGVDLASNIGTGSDPPEA